MKSKERILVILAGGASSRLKKSLNDINLDKSVSEIAKSSHKTLIPLGDDKRPLLYFILQNAVVAGVRDFFIITSPDNSAFKSFIETKAFKHSFSEININFAIQYKPKDREKPLGTSDALIQAMDQYEILKMKSFVIINGDNLYSVKSLNSLFELDEEQHALISYDRDALNFPHERLTKFALINVNENNKLINIIEKPPIEEVDNFRDKQNKIRVSMNIFKFFGPTIYPFIKNCPLHPERKEKEIPEAVRNYIKDFPNSFDALPFFEHIPDLTSARDILTIIKSIPNSNE
ncbi:MAG: sugar phosphate nucleotidyltransferase [Bacteroidota bacterium]|nr:sugar phosphate nucleotidyltransferase [Bacteroidota bacterium]